MMGWRDRRFVRAGNGQWRLRLPSGEVAVLRSLGPQLRTMLTDSDDPDLRRLFPTAYADDAEAEAFYRQVARDELMAGRLESLARFERCLDGGDVSTEELEGFMGTVNDLRLVLGTKLDVSEDDDLADLADDDPTAPAAAIYAYLGYLLEQVVDALLDVLPPEPPT